MNYTKEYFEEYINNFESKSEQVNVLVELYNLASLYARLILGEMIGERLK